MKSNFLKTATLALFLAAGVTSGARAEEEPSAEPTISPFYSAGAQRLSLQVGMDFPTSVNHLSTSQKSGPTGGVQYLYQWDDYWALGAQADFYRLDAKDHANRNSDGGGVNIRSKDDVATLEAFCRYNFLPAARVVPYFHTGVGATYFHQTADGEPLAGSTWNDTGTTETRSLQDAKTLNFSYSVGLGVEVALTNHLILGLESAWHVFGVSQTTFGTQGINVPTLSMRLGWRFGH